MAEMANALRGENTATTASSKVTPILDVDEMIKIREELEQQQQQQQQQQVIIHISLPPPSESGRDEYFADAGQMVDDWLPITESRKGNSFSATFHLLCSGIGFQALLLPMAFVSLGWFWGILCLSLAFSWQLYTMWLLVNLHESNAQTGTRYSRFLHLSIVAFGEKWGKLLAMFPTMYLSGGTCVQFIITGGATMEMLFQIMCENNMECKSKTLNGAQWFLVFICLAIFIAQFFPNLNSLATVSFIGSITGIAYCTLLWALSVNKSGGGSISGEAETTSDHVRVRDVLNGVGFIVLAFRGHNLVLEIQGTMPTNSNKPSRKPMWRGVTVSYIMIAMCLYPLAIVGHWAYGNKISKNGGFLGSFTKFHQNNTSKYIIGAILVIIIINYLCSFQIYAMATFDNLQRIYVSKKNKPCPRWVRSAIKVLFGGLVYFIAVAFPFLPSLGSLIGSLALPLTLSYPCFMWIAIKKPRRFSRMWCINLVFGCSGIVLSVVIFVVALWSLIVNGLDAYFFKPR